MRLSRRLTRAPVLLVRLSSTHLEPSGWSGCWMERPNRWAAKGRKSVYTSLISFTSSCMSASASCLTAVLGRMFVK